MQWNRFKQHNYWTNLLSSFQTNIVPHTTSILLFPSALQYKSWSWPSWFKFGWKVIWDFGLVMRSNPTRSPSENCTFSTSTVLPGLSGVSYTFSIPYLIWKSLSSFNCVVSRMLWWWWVCNKSLKWAFKISSECQLGWGYSVSWIAVLKAYQNSDSQTSQSLWWLLT